MKRSEIKRSEAYSVEDATAAKITPQSRPTNGSTARKVPVRQLVHLTWRMAIAGAAVLYVWVSLRAGYGAIGVLRGEIYHSMDFVPYEGHLLKRYVGPTTIRRSRIMEVIGNTPAPRNDTLFLESADQFSFNTCSNIPAFNAWLYSNTYLRELWTDLATNTAYNISFFDGTKLIVPIVDCSFGSITSGDDTVARIYYLVRTTARPDDVYIATVSFSIQAYQLNDEYENGAIGVASMTFINDVSSGRVEYYYAARVGYPYQATTFEPFKMIETSEDGFWVLESIPLNSSREASQVIRTASRTGFFIDAETEQSNIKNLVWEQPQDPITSMSVWQWVGHAVLKDSWAWVHEVHVLFALDTLVNILLLFSIVYRNMKMHKFWMGDAFMSVTATIEIRGLLVLVTWYINGFWRLMEFCLMDANDQGNAQRIKANAYIIRADLLTIYMCLAGLLGKLLRERVDPALVVFIFELGFHNRLKIASWLPSLSKIATDFAVYDYMKGMATVLPKYTTVSPMRLWTIHPMVRRDVQFIIAALLPTFAPFILVVAYVFVRKLYRRIVPETKVVWSRATGQSTNEADAHLSWKSTLTMFEVATGAPLQNRVGLASDYDNCIYIKGMKFASPDGIYCNGYVIVNEKYLVAATDIPAIALIVASRVRFKNVYIYEVHGHKAQQVARLVYPHTMSLKDLSKLNISILS